MSSNKSSPTSISAAELEVLKVLWNESPLDAEHIINRLETQGSSHPRTVKTLLNRLVKKHAIAFKESDRRYHYYAIIDKDQYYLQETESFLEKFFNAQVSPLVSLFSQQNKLDKEDIDELEKLVKKLKEQS